MMAHTMKQNLVQPCAAVGAGFKPIKGAPRLKVDLLDHVFRLSALTGHAQRRPEEVAEMRHRLRFEALFGGSVAVRWSG